MKDAPQGRPAPWITTFSTREGWLLYHDLTGRTLRLKGEIARYWAALYQPTPPPAWADPAGLSALLGGGFLTTQVGNPWHIIAPLYAVRARWAVYAETPEALWLSERDCFEGGPWRARRLDELEAQIWRQCDGEHSVQEILRDVAQQCGPELMNDALEILLGWTHGRVQLVKLLDAPLGSHEHPPPHFYSLIHDLPRIDLAQRAADAPIGAGPVDLHAYHVEAIQDAHEQFEERETTLSHLLREPSPVLGGLSYGAAWVRLIEGLGALPVGARVLEVGGGTGWLARRALEARPDLRWHIADLSGALLRDQQRLFAQAQLQVRAVHADALALPFAPQSFDVIVSNEVIADLPTAAQPADAQDRACLEATGYRPPEGRPVNFGALRLLVQAAQLLRPGGWLWLSEFGTIDQAPREAVHLDHPETGIEFGVLAQAAERLGLTQVALKRATEYLPFAPVPVLASPPAQFAALNALLEALGAQPLAKLAYDPERFEAAIAPVPAASLRQVAFAPATERVMTFPPAGVWALSAQRPLKAL